ncbi:MAG: hypothetical protein EBX37_11350, partial [Alphaproteobacteria bacterium]|nr:hypothetical protein [Alphaproteobacteria bacterium]
MQQKCMDICAKDPACQGGYVLHAPSSSRAPETSTCVALNRSFSWANMDLLANRISYTGAKTPISPERGYEMSVFYNAHRFPERLPKSFSTFLFSGCSVFLVWDSSFYMDNQLFFQEQPSRANSFMLRQAFSHPFQYMTRINRELSMNLYHKASNTRLATWKRGFKWQPMIGREVSSFSICPRRSTAAIQTDEDNEDEDDDLFWINEKMSVDLFLSSYENPDTIVYLSVDPKTRRLSTSSRRPAAGFQWILDRSDDASS